MIDLHAHTIASDGELSSSALVAEAARRGVATLAVTDHDSFDGVAEAVEEGTRLGVRVIAGIELTVQMSHGSMHLLGYFPDGPPSALVARLDELSAFRELRIRRIVERLDECGVPVGWDAVRERAAGQLGRPHVAAALVAAGHVASREEAFERWLADGRPAHVPSRGLEPEVAVRLVRACGGAPVLAHPGSLALPPRHLEAFTQRLASYGLLGVEVHRPEHTPEQRDAYARVARRLRLIPSGGSDFHRPDGPVALGETGVPPLDPGTVERLFAAAGAAAPGAGGRSVS